MSSKVVTYDKPRPVEPKPENAVEVAKGTEEAVQAADVEKPEDTGHRTQENSAREAHVTIQNLTGYNFVLLDYGKYSGSEWVTPPPDRINFGDRGYLRVDSNGFMEGAHGWVRYQFENDGRWFYFQFDDYYIGTNYFNYEAPTGYGCNIKGGSGNDAYVTFECWKDNS